MSDFATLYPFAALGTFPRPGLLATNRWTRCAVFGCGERTTFRDRRSGSETPVCSERCWNELEKANLPSQPCWCCDTFTEHKDSQGLPLCAPCFTGRAEVRPRELNRYGSPESEAELDALYAAVERGDVE